VRFVDFLKTTVLLSAGAATTLAAVTVLAAGTEPDYTVVYVGVAWWLVATATGAWMGRRAQTTPPIARLLAGSRTSTSLPEPQSSTILLNRLWPLLLVTLVAGVIGLFLPQVAAMATGFAIIWALAWRRQESAVAAIEERDAVRFYIERTSPLAPMKLVRTPGFGGDFLRVNGAREGAS